MPHPDPVVETLTLAAVRGALSTTSADLVALAALRFGRRLQCLLALTPFVHR